MRGCRKGLKPDSSGYIEGGPVNEGLALNFPHLHPRELMPIEDPEKRGVWLGPRMRRKGECEGSRRREEEKEGGEEMGRDSRGDHPPTTHPLHQGSRHDVISGVDEVKAPGSRHYLRET